MKMALRLLTIFSLTVASSASHATEVLSVKTWAKQVRSALKDGDLKTFSALTDLPKLEQAVLTRQESTDRKTMKTARELFTQGKFDASLEKYNTVEKNSDFWFEAVEEKGWAFHREKSYEKALAQTKTLLTQPFLSIVGAEPFFLQSLTQLKICDYKGILETHKLFKDSQKSRITEIQNLAKSGTGPAVNQVIERADAFPLSFQEVGEPAKNLPRLFYRDQKLQVDLLQVKLTSALEGLSDFASTKLTDAFSKTLAQYKQAAASAKQDLQERVKALAQTETDENFKIVQKLNLIEIETIQRIHADRELDKNSYTKGKFKQASVDDMVFPDDGQPWMDELDKYQVRVNSCPQDLRRKM